MSDNGQNRKTAYGKWFVFTSVFVVGLLVIFACLNIAVDPYFHYHKPVTKYRLNYERYINDGIARHFDYDAIIIGNSLFQNFKTGQYDELNDVKSVKLPYSGAGTRELWLALGRAVGREPLSVDLLSYDEEDGADFVDSYNACSGYNNSVKEVVVCTDTEDIMRRYSWHRYNDYPTYLYDDNLFNDAEYIFNKDTFYRGTLYNLGITLLGKDSTSFDDYSSWVRESGPKAACATLKTIDKDTDGLQRQLSDGDKERIYYNIHVNMVPVIEANPDTEFKLLIPPASIARWAEYYNRGELAYVTDGMEYMLSILTEFDNVTIYGFDDEFELTADLDRYCDTIHYDAGVSDMMFEDMAAGKHLIDKDNYKEYVNRIRNRYFDYDFTVLNEYIPE